MFIRSSDARYLALSSQDGFCSLVEFENEELGTPFPLSGKQSSFGCCHIFTTKRFIIFLLHIVLDGKVSDKDSKSPLQTANDTITVPTGNVGAVVAESTKTESEEKADCMIIESVANIGAAVVESRETVTQEKADYMVIESTGNDQVVMPDSRKNGAEEKADDMVIEATGSVEEVVSDSRKNEAEEKVDNMVIEPTRSVRAAVLDRKIEAGDQAEKQILSSGSVKCGAEEKAEKPQSSLDGIKSAPAEKAGQQFSSSKSTPIPNKPAKKRITPIAIDP